MTTTMTEPLIDEPSIGVDEMPAWEQAGERVCELCDNDGTECDRTAAWLAVVAEPCVCKNRDRTTLLACPPHRDWAVVARGLQCYECDGSLPLVLTEPIR